MNQKRIHEFQLRWQRLKKTLDASPSNDLLGALRQLLAESVAAGSGHADFVERNILQSIATEVGDYIFRFEREFPNVVIAPFSPPPRVSLAKLPTSSDDFFGRDRELTILDQAWEKSHPGVLILTAWGGAGKTALVNHWLNRMESQRYRGAARVYGWSFYSQGAAEDRQASSDEFLLSALKWFDDTDPQLGAPWEKGTRLAALIKQQCTLLVLDGIEPLQYPPGEMGGLLRDPGLKSLLKELARGQHEGLCIVTSRFFVEDLSGLTKVGVGHVPLDSLSPVVGVTLLRCLGVKGTDKELEVAVSEYKGHALSLTLLGRYLAIAHDGEICRRDRILSLENEKDHGNYARLVMHSYENLFNNKPELDILFLMGLFDRPVESKAIQVLLREPPIDGLTDHLCSLSDENWKYAESHLRNLRLLAETVPGAPELLDCHPLVREHFGSLLKTLKPKAWKEAHLRLFAHYSGLPTTDTPDTLEEVMPLFHAVTHGCAAGRYEDALNLFRNRIERGWRQYSVQKLGCAGRSLSALSGFFTNPWSNPVECLTQKSKARVLDEAGRRLQAVARLREAIAPGTIALKLFRTLEMRKDSAFTAGRLSELHLYLGEINEALTHAMAGRDDALKSGDTKAIWFAFYKLGNACHQKGMLPEAQEAFQRAERTQIEYEPAFPYLYSWPGFLFCDLFLSQGNLCDAKTRAEAIMNAGRDDYRERILDEGLHHLMLGRLLLLERRHLDSDHSPNPDAAAELIEKGVADIMNSGFQDEVPRALLARAELHRLNGAFEVARNDLEDARERAERSQMRLYLVEYHLEAARLWIAQNKLEYSEECVTRSAREHWLKAKEIIAETGYGRRNCDVQELEKLLEPLC